jgi:DNA-binding NarL/FixJ family response regulator
MKKILVVDDDSILRKVLRNYLEQQGYQVQDASSGTEGLAAFELYSPDLIVSDVAMPEVDGFEFCRRLRSQPSGQLVPFIFLSARDDLEDKIQGHSMGADDYLTKPFEMKELLAKIEALLERTRRIHSEIVRLLQQMTNQPSSLPNIDRESKPINAAVEGKKLVPLPLTPAEERVFWEVIQGLTNKQISDNLFISPRTVQTHLSSILTKLKLDNRTQLVRFAYEQGYDKQKDENASSS